MDGIPDIEQRVNFGNCTKWDYYMWIKALERVFKAIVDGSKDSDGVFELQHSGDIMKLWVKLIDPLANERITRAKTVLDFVKSYINPRNGEPLIGKYTLVGGRNHLYLKQIKEEERWKAEQFTHR